MYIYTHTYIHTYIYTYISKFLISSMLCTHVRNLHFEIRNFLFSNIILRKVSACKILPILRLVLAEIESSKNHMNLL